MAENSVSIPLDKSFAVRGIAILGIVLFHYSQLIYCPPGCSFLLKFGAVGCAIFFFLSGYGMSLQRDAHSKKSFKRIIKLYCPLLLSNILFAIYLSINNLYKIDGGNISLSGLLWTGAVNPFGWFLAFLIILYVAVLITDRFHIPLIITSFILAGSYTVITKSPMTLSWLAFPAGYYIRRLPAFGKVAEWASAIIFLATFIVFVEKIYLNTPVLLLNFVVMVLSAGGLSVLLTRIDYPKPVILAGRHSLSIYLMHALAITIVSGLGIGIIAKTITFVLLTALLVPLFDKINGLATKTADRILN